MTEKRFETNMRLVIDTEKKYGARVLNAEEVVGVLNSLSEENKQLKEQLEMCKDARQSYKQDWKACVSYCDTYKDEIHTLKDNIQGLIEENKQLKKENEELKEEKEKWKSNCSLAISENSILWNEINILREQGAEPSDAFKNYLNKKGRKEKYD